MTDIEKLIEQFISENTTDSFLQSVHPSTLLSFASYIEMKLANCIKLLENPNLSTLLGINNDELLEETINLLSYSKMLKIYSIEKKVIKK